MFFTSKKLIISLLLAVMLVGCSAKSNKGGAGDGSGTGEFSDQDLAMQNQQRWADGGTIPTAQAGGQFQDIYFAFDSSTVESQYFDVIQTVANALRADSALRVEVEGHCDSRGTSEYNMALGERRAGAVSKMLAGYGVPSSQITTVSYGEELPVVQSEDESAFAKNRRAHFAVNRSGAR